MDESVRILLVDPDHHMAEECQQAVESRGWLMHHARTFSQALDFIDQSPYDLVILEMSLPDRVGTDAWRHIKAVLPDVRGVFITSSRVLRNSVATLERDILAFLLKPIDMEALCESVAHMLKSNSGTAVNQQLSVLGDLLLTLNQALGSPHAFQTFLANLQRLVQPDWIAVYLLDHADSAWTNHFIQSFSPQGGVWTPAQSNLIEGWMLEAVRSQRVLVFDSTFPLAPDQANPRDMGLGTFVIVPLAARRRMVGALGIVNRAETTRTFAPVEIELVTSIGRVIGLTLDNARLEREKVLATVARAV